MKAQREKHCLVCGKEYDKIIFDGIRSHAICKNKDHVLKHDWMMFHYGGLKAPTFITFQVTVSFPNNSIVIDYDLDDPSTLTILNQGISNIANRYNTIKVHAKDLTIDWKDLPRLIKVIKENYAFI